MKQFLYYGIWWSCSQSFHLLHMWPWFSAVWNLFMYFSVFLLKLARSSLKQKLSGNALCVHKWIWLTTIGSCKSSKLTAHRQSWTMEIMQWWWKKSNSYKQVRPDHCAWTTSTSPSPHSCSSSVFGNMGWIFVLIFLCILIRPDLMSCTPCRN